MSQSVSHFRKLHAFGERSQSVPCELSHLESHINTHGCVSGSSDEENGFGDGADSTTASLDFTYGSDVFLQSGNEFYSNQLTHSSDEDDVCLSTQKKRLFPYEADDILLNPDDQDMSAHRLVWSKPLLKPRGAIPRSQSTTALMSSTYYSERVAPYDRVSMSQIQTRDPLHEFTFPPGAHISSSSSNGTQDGSLSDGGQSKERRRKRDDIPRQQVYSKQEDKAAVALEAQFRNIMSAETITTAKLKPTTAKSQPRLQEDALGSDSSSDSEDDDYVFDSRRRGLARRSSTGDLFLQERDPLTASEPVGEEMPAPIKNLKLRQPPPPVRQASREERDHARKKRHNIVEQNRRILMNNTLDRLRTLIPGLNNKTPKAVTLFACVDYIRQVLDEQAGMKAELKRLNLPLPAACGEAPPAMISVSAECARSPSPPPRANSTSRPAPQRQVSTRQSIRGPGKASESVPVALRTAAPALPLRVAQLRLESIPEGAAGAEAVPEAMHVSGVRRSVSVPYGLDSRVWGTPAPASSALPPQVPLSPRASNSNSSSSDSVSITGDMRSIEVGTPSGTSAAEKLKLQQDAVSDECDSELVVD